MHFSVRRISAACALALLGFGAAAPSFSGATTTAAAPIYLTGPEISDPESFGFSAVFSEAVETDGVLCLRCRAQSDLDFNEEGELVEVWTVPDNRTSLSLDFEGGARFRKTDNFRDSFVDLGLIHPETQEVLPAALHIKVGKDETLAVEGRLGIANRSLLDMSGGGAALEVRAPYGDALTLSGGAALSISAGRLTLAAEKGGTLNLTDEGRAVIRLSDAFAATGRGGMHFAFSGARTEAASALDGDGAFTAAAGSPADFYLSARSIALEASDGPAIEAIASGDRSLTTAEAGDLRRRIAMAAAEDLQIKGSGGLVTADGPVRLDFKGGTATLDACPGCGPTSATYQPGVIGSAFALKNGAAASVQGKDVVIAAPAGQGKSAASLGRGYVVNLRDADFSLSAQNATMKGWVTAQGASNAVFHAETLRFAEDVFLEDTGIADGVFAGATDGERASVTIDAGSAAFEHSRSVNFDYESVGSVALHAVHNGFIQVGRAERGESRESTESDGGPTSRVTLFGHVVAGNAVPAVLENRANGVLPGGGSDSGAAASAPAADAPGRIDILAGAGSRLQGSVLAVNGGTVRLTLKGGPEEAKQADGTAATLGEGRLDDHTGAGMRHADGRPLVLRPHEAMLSEDEGSLSPGRIELALENAAWRARDRNFLTKLHFAGQSAAFLLTSGSGEALHGASLYAGEVSGEGVVRLHLSKKMDPSGERRSDMLYIGRLAPDASIRLVIETDPDEAVADLKGLRFATTGENASAKGSGIFTARLADQGFYDRDIRIRSSAYEKSDPENAACNGLAGRDAAAAGGAPLLKPGNDFVDAFFGENGTNWYLDGFAGDEDEKPGNPDEHNLPDEPDHPSEPGNPNQPGTADGGNAGNGGAGEHPAISSAGRAMLGTARALYWNAVSLERRDERTGERLGRTAEGKPVYWTRLRYDRFGTKAGVSDFRSDDVVFQFGAEGTRRLGAAEGDMILGAALDFRSGKTHYSDVSGSGETERLGGFAYATWTAPTGFYADFVARAGRIKADYSLRAASGMRLRGKARSPMFGASVEAGQRFTGAAGWFVEPQLQLQYARVASADWRASQTKLQTDALDSLIGRGGLRLGRAFGKDEGEAGARRSIAYVRGDVLHEWLGETTLHAQDATTGRSGADVRIANGGTWFNAGAGLDWQVSADLRLSAEASARFGGNLERAWTLGINAVRAF